MRSIVALAVVSVSFAATDRRELSSQPLAAHETPRASDVLKITVYDWAHVRHEILADAVNQLRVIFRQAGIVLDVVLGDPQDEDAALFTYVPLPPKDREREAGCQARRDIRLKILGSSPAGLSNSVLGMSSPFARAGHNVRLFGDHIRQAAARHSRPYATVLSYAMSHEIGHVLLRSGSHGDRGIMSAVWTAHEYARMDRGGVLFFTDDEVKKILANVGRRGCPTTPAIF